MTEHTNFQDEVSRVFFGDVSSRPNPRDIVRLIGKGLTEQMVVTAALSKGMRLPIMDMASQEHAAMQPYIWQLTDRLAQDHPDDIVLCGDRDAALFRDDFVIRHPNHPAHLMPASRGLWSSSGMSDDTLAARFLGKYGLTEAAATSDDTFVFVDTGFYGSIGVEVDRRFAELYGVSLRQTGRFHIKLVSTAIGGTVFGQHIMTFPGGRTNFGPKTFPRVNQNIGQYLNNYSETAALAIAIQLMPHNHASFKDLQMRGNEVDVTLATNEPLTEDDIDQTGEFSINTSVINPAAAAIFQYRTVSGSLARMS